MRIAVHTLTDACTLSDSLQSQISVARDMLDSELVQRLDGHVQLLFQQAIFIAGRYGNESPLAVLARCLIDSAQANYKSRKWPAKSARSLKSMQQRRRSALQMSQADHRRLFADTHIAWCCRLDWQSCAAL